MAEPWDSLRALFPTNTEGLIGAGSMRSQVDELETQDGLNVKVADLYNHNYELSAPGAITATSSGTEVDNLTVTDADAGTYEIKVSYTLTLDSIANSAFTRVSPDGGTTWYSNNFEPGDTTDVSLRTFIFPVVHTTGDLEVSFEAWKEDAGDTMAIPMLYIAATRVS